MLVLQTQKNNGEAEWIEIEHKGETILVTAGKRKTIMPGYRDNSVSMFFKGSKDWKVLRTGNFIKKGGNNGGDNGNA